MKNLGIILIHGLGGTPTEMKYVGNFLEKKGILVRYCSLAGHCSTLKDLRNSTKNQWIQSVNECYDQISRECKKILVGGLSAGCLLSLQLAMNRKIDGIILYSPTFVLNGWRMPFYMPLLRYLRPWMGFFNIMLKERHPYGIKDDRIRNLVISKMDGADPSEAGSFYTPIQTMLQFNVLAKQVEKNLNNINIPILSIHSLEDDVADINNSYKLFNTDSIIVDICKLDDSYHLVVLDKQRDKVCEETYNFIKKWVY